ncbi:MAG: hypothetical protein ACLUHA_05250 [Bacteroides stercoris]
MFAHCTRFDFDQSDGEVKSFRASAARSETTEVIFQFVNSYLSQTKNGIFIGVGLIMLLWTVLNLSQQHEITSTASGR